MKIAYQIRKEKRIIRNKMNKNDLVETDLMFSRNLHKISHRIKIIKDRKEGD